MGLDMGCIYLNANRLQISGATALHSAIVLRGSGARSVTWGGCKGGSGIAGRMGDSEGAGVAAFEEFTGVFKLSSRMLLKSKLWSVTAAALTRSMSRLGEAAKSTTTYIGLCGVSCRGKIKIYVTRKQSVITFLV